MRGRSRGPLLWLLTPSPRFQRLDLPLEFVQFLPGAGQYRRLGIEFFPGHQVHALERPGQHAPELLIGLFLEAGGSASVSLRLSSSISFRSIIIASLAPAMVAVIFELLAAALCAH